MEEGLRDNLEVAAERAVCVKVLLPGIDRDMDDSLAELRALAGSAGSEVVGELTQKREKPRGSSYLGSGKLEELVHLVEMVDAKLVLFDNELAPMQIKAIEEAVGCKVLDRSELILDIFASRAQTKEARLQVEIAQLQYTAPRLRAMWSHLGQVTGGAPIGVGTRGPGEQQLEIDRRLVQKRLSVLRRRLADVQARRSREVSARRSEHFTVGLVGYTNAGKSTLFNALTHGGAWVADQLFATLSTRVDAWAMGGGAQVLLSDTVGFISNLPHHLVASFRATLEETIAAHMLLIVLDIADDEAERQYDTVRTVLEDIGAGEQLQVLVLNKYDALEERLGSVAARERVEQWQEREPASILVSARTGLGLESLAACVKSEMRGAIHECTIEAPMADSRLADYLEKRTEILERNWTETAISFRVRIGRRQVEELLANGSKFSLDGVRGAEAFTTVWPEPTVRRQVVVPPHERQWPSEHVEDLENP